MDAGGALERSGGSRWWRAADWLLALAGIAAAAWQVGSIITAYDHPDADLRRLAWGWLAAAAALSIASLLAYGELHRRLLVGGGASLSGRFTQAVTFAGNAVSLTVPAAGAAAGPAYVARALHRRGVSVSLSVWVVAAAGVLTSIILVTVAPLSLAGAGLLNVPAGAATSVLLAALAIGAWRLLQQPRVVRWLTRRAGRWVRPAPLPGWILLLTLGVLTWALDYLALAGCLAATAAPVSWPAVTIGYFAVQAGMLLHLTPGGAGPVEAGLLAGLTAGGVPVGSAAVAVVLYRAVSWVGPSVIGWCVLLILAGRAPAARGHP